MFIRLCLLNALLFPLAIFGQQNTNLPLAHATLDNVVQYAISNYPLLKQIQLDEKITNTSINGKLADWFPQLNLGYNLQHNFDVPTNVINGNLIRLGVNNTSNVQLTATQNLLNRDAILATVTAKDVRLQSAKNTENLTISLVVNVSKAFYDVLATSQQVKVGIEEITRLERSLQDATSRYQTGIADKIDYKRATIALNNSRAVYQSNLELYKAKISYLKTLMGYPSALELDLEFDTESMQQQIAIDTFQEVNFDSRVELQQLDILKKLQKSNLAYSTWSFLPSLSANGNYIFLYQNNDFTQLYNRYFPNSFIGLSMNFPIFQGGKRVFNIRQQKLQLDRIDYSISNFKNVVNTEHAHAIANYKSYLTQYNTLHENLSLAQEVYDVVNLQYKSGIKTYLEVVTAETDLHNAKINYYNSLYQVLAAKIDLQKALGQIKWQ